MLINFYGAKFLSQCGVSGIQDHSDLFKDLFHRDHKESTGYQLCYL